MLIKKDFIINNGIIKETDLLEDIKKFNGTIYALYNNILRCGENIDETNISNLLEVRIFNEDSEAKYYRSNVNKDFSFRYIDDVEYKKILESKEKNDFLKKFENRILDDIQYLDIDKKKSFGNDYTTTGGGYYTLPIENAEKIKIRNYVDYDEQGLAYISDFRIIKIMEEGEK